MNPSTQTNVQSLTGTGGMYNDQGQPFTDSHNDVYNGLRNLMLHYNAAGVPGMDKVLNTLNKTHTEVSQNYQGDTLGNIPPAPSVNSFYNNQPNPQYQPMQDLVNYNPQPSLNNVMRNIQSQNTPQMPNGYGGYNGGSMTLKQWQDSGQLNNIKGPLVYSGPIPQSIQNEINTPSQGGPWGRYDNPSGLPSTGFGVRFA